MLYDCWLRVAQASPDLVALRDLASGRSWTFRQLAAEAESVQQDGRAIVFAEGASAEFILSVLRAWRAGAALCPAESRRANAGIAGDLPESIVHLKTTSATTGAPRLVAFTAEELIADAQNITEAMGLRPDFPNLGVISLAHSYGFSNLVLPLLLHGIPLVLVGSTLPEAIRRAAAIAPAVTLAAVPALWQSWHDAGAIPPNVRLAISAGAPLALPLEQSVFAERGLKIHNFYGSSECGGIAFDSTTKPRVDAGLAGAPLRKVEVSIAEDGCLEVRGPAVAQTYWPEASPKLHQGIFRTSDLGAISNGFIYLRGRASDQINVAGRKVLPEAIERVLAAHPQVRSCLAFGVPSPDAQRGESIVACVASTAGLNQESLKQFALVKLPAWQVPRHWWFVDALEVNGRGKLSRADWRKRYLETAGKERV